VVKGKRNGESGKQLSCKKGEEKQRLGKNWLYSSATAAAHCFFFGAWKGKRKKKVGGKLGKRRKLTKTDFAKKKRRTGKRWYSLYWEAGYEVFTPSRDTQKEGDIEEKGDLGKAENQEKHSQRNGRADLFCFLGRGGYGGRA